ncbi:MAG: zf-TFIIB domain-containing protein [Actinobacteria bacterium]|nr:zf-TFIIB domain-containing protein [Actinomycetota bacterium]
MTTSLTCPKCGSEMRSYERNRVLVDQCTGCGGLFLDRGELEALVAAENAWHGGGGAAQQAPQQARPQDSHDQAPQQAYGQQPAYGQQAAYNQPPAQPYGQAPYAKYSKAYGQQPAQHYGQAPYAKYSKAHGYRKRRSFLSDLFDD